MVVSCNASILQKPFAKYQWFRFKDTTHYEKQLNEVIFAWWNYAKHTHPKSNKGSVLLNQTLQWKQPNGSPY